MCRTSFGFTQKVGTISFFYCGGFFKTSFFVEIRRLPAIVEYVFVTPSHHRVHHARNPSMIDRNYAGMFILWDRLFGTFQPENEKCVYGLVHPIQTFNPLRAQFDQILAVL
jgi:sterol desaturase/sphingolipid hydroxylase (fatty acid hydroxylase superfamily)